MLGHLNSRDRHRPRPPKSQGCSSRVCWKLSAKHASIGTVPWMNKTHIPKSQMSDFLLFDPMFIPPLNA
jgi:hypothetical protein